MSSNVLTVIGSADAFNAAGRGHSCYLLEGDGFGPLMIDFGATALLGLRRLGRSPAEIGGFAFTHLHGDHIGGYPFLVIDGMFHHVRSELLEVVGPVGLEARLARLIDATYGDLSKHERPFETRYRQLGPGGELQLAGAQVRAFAAEHMDEPDQALCLRVTLPDGKSVAFSGDTAPCDGLREAAAGADVLVADCSCLAPPCGRHHTWQHWREAAATIGAKRLLLSHLGADVRARAESLLAEAPAGAEVTFADDGMQLQL